jgi:hypothetical protein
MPVATPSQADRAWWLCVALGGVLLVVALWKRVDAQGFVARAERLDGVVIDLVGHDDTDDEGRVSTTWSPTVRFTSPEGRSSTFTTTSASSPPLYAKGEHVTVLYVAGETPRLDGFMELWFPTLLLGGAGIVAVVVGAFGLRRRRQREGFRAAVA